MTDEYISGDWTVQAGSEEEFVERWRAFTGWALENASGAKGFVLIRDLNEPRHFVSFGTWTDRASVDAWRRSPEFGSRLVRCREICEHFSGSDYAIAAELGAVSA